MKKGTLILDTYLECYDIGIVDKIVKEEGIYAHWLEYNRVMFTNENFAVLSGGCLGVWE